MVRTPSITDHELVYKGKDKLVKASVVVGNLRNIVVLFRIIVFYVFFVSVFSGREKIVSGVYVKGTH